MSYYCCGCASTVTTVGVASLAAVAQSVYRIQPAIRNASFLRNVETDSVINTPTPTPPPSKGTGVSFVEGKAVGREAGHSHQSTA
jgi:hypothetical protein